MAGKLDRRQECHTRKKKKKIQVQFVVCQRQCWTTPSVKQVMKKLSSTRKSCEIPEWNRRPVLPSRTQTGDNADTQNKDESVTKTTTCSGLKFSTTCEAINVKTGSETQRKKRQANMLNVLGLDSSIISKQVFNSKQDILSPCVKGSSDATPTDKAAATGTSESQFSNISEPQKLRKYKTTDKDVPEHILGENPRTPASSKKKGRKMKAENADLLLQQMIQCCKMLQGSCSDSHRHIAQLLSQEIEKAKEGELTTAPEEPHRQNLNGALGKPDETGELRVDDHGIDSPVLEDIPESQVLEIEATFLVKASAEGAQEIRGVSLFPPTMLFSGVEMGMNCVTEENSANRGLNGALTENNNEVLPSGPPILSPQHTQPKPHSSLPNHISPESFSLDPHYTMPELEPCSPHNIQPVPNNTQPDPHSSIQSHVQPEPHPSIPSHTQSEPHSSIPSHTQPEPHSSIPSHTHLEPQYTFPNHTQQGHHYTVINRTQPEHRCSPSRTIQEKSLSVVPHTTKLEPDSCFSDETEIELDVSISQGDPTERDCSVVAHTQTEFHCADLQENQREPQFSILHHSQSEPLSIHPHNTQKDPSSLLPHHTQTEHHFSEPEHHYPSCATLRKKRQKKSWQKSKCNYNLRSKDLKSNTSEMVTDTQLKNLNTLLKTHCKSNAQVYFRKMEYYPSSVADNSTESLRLPHHTNASDVNSMSLPISIPVQVLSLPNGQEDVTEGAERDDDSQEGEGVESKYKEGYISDSSKMACTEGDMEWAVCQQGDEERLVQDAQGGMDAKSCERVVDVENCLGGTSAKNSVRKTDSENNLGGLTDVEISFKGTDADNCEKVEVDEVSQKETSAEDSQMMVVSAKKYMEGSVVKGHQTVVLGAGNSQEGTSAESHQTEAVGVEKSQRGTGVEVCLMEAVGAENSQGGTGVEGCLMEVVGTEKSQEGTVVDGCLMEVVGAEDNQEETGAESCRMVVVDAENSQERTAAVGCQMVVVGTENIQEETGAEGCHMVVVSAENSQEGTVAEECQMEVVGAGNSFGKTGAESQVSDESISSLMPSLYGDENSYFNIHNMALPFDQKCRFTLYDFHTKQKPDLDKTSVSDNAEAFGVNVKAPAGKDLSSSVGIEQSDAFSVDKIKDAKKAEDEKCPAAHGKILLCQHECVSDADIYDPNDLHSQTVEGNIVTQYVHHLTDEAQPLDDLERHLESVEDWAVQNNSGGPSVTWKDSTVDVESQVQESPEGKSNPREDNESPADPASASLSQVQNIQNDGTNSTEKGRTNSILSGQSCSFH